MSSYRGGGAWDDGPPGADEYAGQRYVAPPTTDPWTGASYASYGYDYASYGVAPGTYSYGGYDPAYYQQHQDYYKNAYATTPQAGYAYPQQRPRDHPPETSSYKSKSRSISPYPKKERSYSNRDSRSRSHSRSRKVKSRKYSTSSSSRSNSPSPVRSVSRTSSEFNRDYKKKIKQSSLGGIKIKKEKRSPTPSSVKKPKDDDRQRVAHSHFPGEVKVKTERGSVCPKWKRHPKRSDRSVTPPRSYRTPERTSSDKNRRKSRSVTPPRSYARSRSHHSSKSHSRSPSGTPPPHKTLKTKSRKRSGSRSQSRDSSRSRSSRSRTPLKRRARSKTRSTRRTPRAARSNSRSGTRTPSPQAKSRSRRSRSASNSIKCRRYSRGRSSSRHASKTKSRRRSISKSTSGSSRSRSGSSDDERRGQFTVRDRKRFWKMHRSKQVERARQPPMEKKPPPGAVEATKVDDLEYGMPPEVDGPNFAELLPTPDQILQQPSTSKPKVLPIKNDGSFLEMFKKLQEETEKIEAQKKPEIKKPVLPFIGKRRGGRVLKTGMVKKAKAIDEQLAESTPKDAWSLYMQEVKKYRETSCEEERKTRPLVK